MRHVLIFTNSFPNPSEPARGIYTGQIAEELARRVAVTVMSPLPWFPEWRFLERFPDWFLYATVPRMWTWRGIPSHAVRYVVLPRMFGWSHALSVYASAIGRVREIHKENRLDLINGHYLYPDGVAAVMIGRSLGIPVVLTAQGSDVNYLAEIPGRRFQICWALRRCQAVTAKSEALAREMVSLGVPAGKMTTIPNGVDDILFSPGDKASARRALGIPLEKRTLVFVGYLREVKGLRILMAALERLSGRGREEFTTFLVGDGPLRAELEKRVACPALKDRVRILGIRPYSEIPLWMRAADLFCLPSLNEGMPNVVLEALASGTPVVATNVGGIPDLVRNGNGILVPPGDADALADALAKGFDEHWDAGTIRGSVRGMSWAQCANRYFEVFERAVARHVP